MASIIGLLLGTLDFKNADVCDDLVNRLHHCVTAGLLGLFGTSTYMYAQQIQFKRLRVHTVNTSTVRYCTKKPTNCRVIHRVSELPIQISLFRHAAAVLRAAALQTSTRVLLLVTIFIQNRKYHLSKNFCNLHCQESSRLMVFLKQWIVQNLRFIRNIIFSTATGTAIPLEFGSLFNEKRKVQRLTRQRFEDALIVRRTKCYCKTRGQTHIGMKTRQKSEAED